MKPSAPSELEDGNAFTNASAAPAHDAAELPSPRLGGAPFCPPDRGGWGKPLPRPGGRVDSYPCVFAVHVDIHETLQRPVTLKDPLLERLPVSIRHEVEEAAEGPFEVDLNLSFAARRDGNRRGQDEPNHDGGLRDRHRPQRNSAERERAAGTHRAKRPAS